MTVIDVQKHTDTLTMVVTAEFDAPVERVWQLWDDPRQLERWWGRRPTRRRSSSTTSRRTAR